MVVTVSGITKKFINKMQKCGRLEYYDVDLPRAFVLADDGKESFVRLSRISSAGLKQRIEGEDFEE